MQFSGSPGVTCCCFVSGWSKIMDPAIQIAAERKDAVCAVYEEKWNEKLMWHGDPRAHPLWAVHFGRNIEEFGKHAYYWLVIIGNDGEKGHYQKKELDVLRSLEQESKGAHKVIVLTVDQYKNGEDIPSLEYFPSRHFITFHGRDDKQCNIDVYEFSKLSNRECPGTIPNVNDVMEYMKGKGLEAEFLKWGFAVKVKRISLPPGVQMTVYKSTGGRWNYNMQMDGVEVKVIQSGTSEDFADGEACAFKLEFLGELEHFNCRLGNTNRCVVSVCNDNFRKVAKRARELQDSCAVTEVKDDKDGVAETRAGYAIEFGRNVESYGKHSYYWVEIVGPKGEDDITDVQRVYRAALTKQMSHIEGAHKLVCMTLEEYMNDDFLTKHSSSNHVITFEGQEGSYNIDVARFAKLDNCECDGTIPTVNDVSVADDLVPWGGESLKTNMGKVTVKSITMPAGAQLQVYKAAWGRRWNYNMDNAKYLVRTVKAGTKEEFKDGEACAYKLQFLADCAEAENIASRMSAAFAAVKSALVGK
eukprot:TRINITY_DN31195_c0_g1_i1.p1 TRINITY_DN31195_c0_g1~~TRINITY_DN31195_c0_g1_i1.p1  ORF type:complete len:529 (+),score=45.19 TRINITY_DN31195_c0_g1_i1:64-1650(+)